MESVNLPMDPMSKTFPGIGPDQVADWYRFDPVLGRHVLVTEHAENLNELKHNPEIDVVLSANRWTVKIGNEIFGWCLENNIEIEFVGRWSENDTRYIAYRISNDQDRTMFALRWAT